MKIIELDGKLFTPKGKLIYVYALNRFTIGVSRIPVSCWQELCLSKMPLTYGKRGENIVFEIPDKESNFYNLYESEITPSYSTKKNYVLLTITRRRK